MDKEELIHAIFRAKPETLEESIHAAIETELYTKNSEAGKRGVCSGKNL